LKRVGFAGACVAAVVGALALWGCAESPPPTPNPRAARDYEPDGGWANYRPAWNEQHPANDPGLPLTGPIVPEIPGSGSIAPTVH
jgi:hypothetical protein